MPEASKLDITSLQKAVHTLEVALRSYLAKNDSLSLDDGEIMRDGVIQRFEYTFELSWKMMKRYLEMYGLEKVDKLANRNFFRICFENGLIRDPRTWFAYLDDRNRTSHVYDQNIAQEVFESAQAFLQDAQFLVAQLEERIGNGSATLSP